MMRRHAAVTMRRFGLLLKRFQATSSFQLGSGVVTAGGRRGVTPHRTTQSPPLGVTPDFEFHRPTPLAGRHHSGRPALNSLTVRVPIKYRPAFPDRFGSIQDARAHCHVFFSSYNADNRHSSFGLLTPHNVHYGLVGATRRRAGDRARHRLCGPPRALPQPRASPGSADQRTQEHA
jgi:hypothetical protein